MGWLRLYTMGAVMTRTEDLGELEQRVRMVAETEGRGPGE